MNQPVKLSKEAIDLLIKLRYQKDPKAQDKPAFWELVDKGIVIPLSTGKLYIAKAMVEEEN